MRRRAQPVQVAVPTSRRALSHPFGLLGPMSDQVLRELAARNAEKAGAAIARMGELYVFHPSKVMR